MSDQTGKPPWGDKPVAEVLAEINGLTSTFQVEATPPREPIVEEAPPQAPFVREEPKATTHRREDSLLFQEVETPDVGHSLWRWFMIIVTGWAALSTLSEDNGGLRGSLLVVVLGVIVFLIPGFFRGTFSRGRSKGGNAV